MDKESANYPKASNIPQIIGNVVLLNYFKHNPNKSFTLTTTTRDTYPVHLLDSDQDRLDLETVNCHKGFFHDHFFNCADTHMVNRYRANDVSTSQVPMHCVQGVRKHF